MRSEQVIKGIVLSEKAYALTEKKVYTLKVDLAASKPQIKAAIKDVFNLDAVEINTSILRGRLARKSRSKKSRPVVVKMPNIKKAYVRLKAGQEFPMPVVATSDEASAQA